MAVFIRRKVSLKKKRFQEDGFDLDLTYITPNVVTMGFPSTGVESVYRNPRQDVKRFFEKRHGGKYKVYNLCAESGRHYEANVFHGRVSYYPFLDHQAPPITLMGDFCKDVEEWMKSEPDNIAAIHCKAGKGRAGMMSCCYLVHSHFKETSAEAMDYYAAQRTYNCQGVTIPSQRRYVTYYQDIRDHGLPPQPTIKIKSLTIATSKYIHPEKSKPYAVILSKGTEMLLTTTPQPGAKAGDTEIDCKNTPITGDIKIVIYDEGISKGQEVSHFWFNTGFIGNNRLDLKRNEIDKAWGDKKFKIFSQEFNITVLFEDAEVSAMDKVKAEKGGKTEVVAFTNGSDVDHNNGKTEAKTEVIAPIVETKTDTGSLQQKIEQHQARAVENHATAAERHTAPVENHTAPQNHPIVENHVTPVENHAVVQNHPIVENHVAPVQSHVTPVENHAVVAEDHSTLAQNHSVVENHTAPVETHAVPQNHPIVESHAAPVEN